MPVEKNITQPEPIVTELNNLGLQQFHSALEANSRWCDLATKMLDELLKDFDIATDTNTDKIDRVLEFADQIMAEYSRNYGDIKEIPVLYQGLQKPN